MKMNSKERLKATLTHQEPDRITVDYGATPVTGIHVLTIKNLREYYGLKNVPVKVTEPYQMLGEVDAELMDLLGVDVIGLNPRTNIIGFESKNWKEFRMWWGQDVLVPVDFNTKTDAKGDLLLFPEGDMSAPPSARMPSAGYFFDTLIRQEPYDEAKLTIEDNMEEFEPISASDLEYWKLQIQSVQNSGKGIVANFGGTALGDIALVPAPFLKYPKGIRDIEEWYMSTLVRPDFIKELYDRQTDIAVENLKKLFGVVGNKVDVIYLCGNDFGTQHSTFCDLGGFREFYVPYYRKMTNWIHQNTEWKVFKHSCGAVEPLIEGFIEAGFDILNPVQVNADRMNPAMLKEKYGDRLVFWGGGVDTQKVLSFGTPGDVKKQVHELCSIFSKQGGFVFNTVHNIQATVPVENIAAMVETVKKFKGSH
jgi:hypothetical protein